MSQIRLFDVRTAMIQAFLNEYGYDGILLSRADNFAMATGGKRNYIYTYSDLGANSLFVTKSGQVFFVGNTIERPRLMAEELGELQCEIRDFLWFESTPAAVVQKHFSGAFCSDDGSLGENVNAKLAPLKALLTMDELEKYRRLGSLAAEAMTATLEATASGMTESDVAAILAAEGAKRRCQVPVNLIAADIRIAQFRHPLPTVNPLLGAERKERPLLGYAMVVGCFLREGLVVSITRFKQVGRLPAAIPDAFNRICAVDAVMQEATRPGRTLGDVFADCQKAYVDMGFDTNEWHNHHQGGATGYAGRTCKGAPGESFRIIDAGWSRKVREVLGEDIEFGAAFAWNPSAPGVKSEDTFILLPDGATEIITETPRLPQVDLAKVLKRETDVVKSGIAEA